MSWGNEVDVHVDYEDMEANIEYYRLIDKLADEFNKNKDEVQQFLGIEDKDLYSHEICFDDASCYGDISVPRSNISELQDNEYEIERLHNRVGEIYKTLEDVMKPLVDWYYIEGGRNENSKLAKNIEKIINKLGL